METYFIFVSIIYKLDARIDPVKGERIKAPCNSHFCLIDMFQEVLLYPLPLKQPPAPMDLESLILFIGDSLGCRLFFFFFSYSTPLVFGLEAYRRQLVSWCLSSFPVSSAFLMELRCWGSWGCTVTEA